MDRREASRGQLKSGCTTTKGRPLTVVGRLMTLTDSERWYGRQREPPGNYYYRPPGAPTGRALPTLLWAAYDRPEGALISGDPSGYWAQNGAKAPLPEP
jgi:hypothetical protein